MIKQYEGLVQTIVTTLFYITSYNSFAPSHCNKLIIHVCSHFPLISQCYDPPPQPAGLLLLRAQLRAQGARRDDEGTAGSRGTRQTVPVGED